MTRFSADLDTTGGASGSFTGLLNDIAPISGQVVPVDGQIWTSASGPLAAGEILDTLEAAVGR